MSVLLFLLSNYKARKFPLRKTAFCLLTWELSALCQTQTPLHGWVHFTGKCCDICFQSDSPMWLVWRANKIGLSSLLLTTVVWEGLNLKVSASVTANETLGWQIMIFINTPSPFLCPVVTLTDDCTLEDFWTSVSQIGSFGSNQAHDVFPVGEKTICYVQRIWHRSSYCRGGNAGRCRSFVFWFRQSPK